MLRDQLLAAELLLGYEPNTLSARIGGRERVYKE